MGSMILCWMHSSNQYSSKAVDPSRKVNAPFDDAPSTRITFETEEGERHDYPLRLSLVAQRVSWNQ
eukprot:CAMPEP_0172312640 /NCGR_PEP_ID=MMETSP1058-20130122/18208_1 /TAXON_ID=83371 /ORGANISM="Detonula confervacea, Strain CCMP 353" /LENGTH=65 /DNA_ID=CAMNT_0013026163 /DNA_START=723 /DNA_END=920 /DNA_ORIENTATION=+